MIHSVSGRTCDKGFWIWNNWERGVIFLLISLKSGKNNHPCTSGLTVSKKKKTSVLQELVHEMISLWTIRSSNIGVRPCVTSGFNGYEGD